MKKALQKKGKAEGGRFSQEIVNRTKKNITGGGEGQGTQIARSKAQGKGRTRSSGKKKHNT